MSDRINLERWNFLVNTDIRMNNIVLLSVVVVRVKKEPKQLKIMKKTLNRLLLTNYDFFPWNLKLIWSTNTISLFKDDFDEDKDDELFEGNADNTLDKKKAEDNHHPNVETSKQGGREKREPIRIR